MQAMMYMEWLVDGTPWVQFVPVSHLPSPTCQRLLVTVALAEPASSMETKQMITCRARCLSCRYRAASLKCAKRRDTSKRHEASHPTTRRLNRFVFIVSFLRHEPHTIEERRYIRRRANIQIVRRR